MWRKWNPLREMEALRREIDRVFEGYGHRESGPSRSVFLPGRSARSYPLLNVSENAEEVVVEALAPGLDTETLEVTVKGDTLTIAGEKRHLGDVEPEAYHRTERSTGKFVRTITIDSEIDDAKVSAQYINGILMVTLPKSERAKPRQITVNIK